MALRIIRRMTKPGRPHIVIVGCGFGGLEAARKLQRAEVDITVVDKTNHHLFQPLLYQVATAGLAAPSIAAPVRLLFRGQPNVTTLLGEVTQIDPAGREVHLADGTRLAWDHLILAAGATHSSITAQAAGRFIACGMLMIAAPSIRNNSSISVRLHR